VIRVKVTHQDCVNLIAIDFFGVKSRVGRGTAVDEHASAGFTNQEGSLASAPGAKRIARPDKMEIDH
jgi:hypothetical protein